MHETIQQHHAIGENKINAPILAKKKLIFRCLEMLKDSQVFAKLVSLLALFRIKPCFEYIAKVKLRLKIYLYGIEGLVFSEEQAG